jgi:hypothetical protein
VALEVSPPTSGFKKPFLFLLGVGLVIGGTAAKNRRKGQRREKTNPLSLEVNPLHLTPPYWFGIDSMGFIAWS